VSFLKSDSFRKLPQISKCTCDYFSKTNQQNLNFCVFLYTAIGLGPGTPGPDINQTTQWTTDVVSTSCQHTKMLCIYPMFHRAILQQWKWMQLNEHWTTRVHKALPAKGIHENLKVCFPNISVQVEFNWYQTSVCWNISILHYRGRNHQKSRVQVHPSRRVSLNPSFKNDGRSFAGTYVGLFSQQILSNFLESV